MTLIKRCTASGEEHGLVDQYTNSVVYDDFKHMTGENKKKILAEKAEDSKVVKVRYINTQGRHERLTKIYCRYPGDPIQKWNLIPNQEYDVPYGMVKEVNASRMPKRSGLVSQDDKPINADGSPLEADVNSEAIHQLVPAKFF